MPGWIRIRRILAATASWALPILYVVLPLFVLATEYVANVSADNLQVPSELIPALAFVQANAQYVPVLTLTIIFISVMLRLFAGFLFHCFWPHELRALSDSMGFLDAQLTAERARKRADIIRENAKIVEATAEYVAAVLPGIDRDARIRSEVKEKFKEVLARTALSRSARSTKLMEELRKLDEITLASLNRRRPIVRGVITSALVGSFALIGWQAAAKLWIMIQAL